MHVIYYKKFKLFGALQVGIRAWLE